MRALWYIAVGLIALGAPVAAEAQDKAFQGTVLDIGAGPGGAVWAIVKPTGSGAAALYARGDDGSWTSHPATGVSGDAQRVAVDPRGIPWLVGGDGKLMRHTVDGFAPVPGAAQQHDVGIGADWAIWTTGGQKVDGGYQIARSRNLGATWTPITGAATGVAVDAAGNGWVVNETHKLFRHDGTAFHPLAQPAQDVAVGQSTVWIVGTEAATNGFAVYASWDQGQSWQKAGASGTRIAADGDSAWVADSRGQVFHVAPPPFSITLTAGPITFDPVPYKPAGPCYEVQPGTGGPSTGGKLVICPEDPPAGTPPIVVSGLPSVFTPVGLQPGRYLCPLIGQGERLLKGCQAPFDSELLKLTNGKATYLGKSGAGASCTGYGRLGGLGYAFHDPRNGGECWACPVLMHRTIYPVDNALACTAGNVDGIMWQSAQYPEPGLSTFVGANGDIVRLALLDAARVDAFLDKRADGDAARKQALWDRMANEPNDSPELKALVYAALLAIARDDPDLRTSVGQASLGMFQSYIQARRSHVAREAAAMYERYLDFNAYSQWSAAKATAAAGGPLFYGAASGVAGVIAGPAGGLAALIGSAPDDYVGAAQAAAVPDVRGAEFVEALSDLASLPAPAPGAQGAGTDPAAWIALGLNTAASTKAVYDMLADLQVVRSIALLNGKTGLGIDLGMNLVGQALDFAAAVMTLYAQQEVGQKYASFVTEESKPVKVGDILTSGKQDGVNSLMTWWALATAAYRPGPEYRGEPMDSAEVCAGDAARCDMIRAVVTNARAKVPAQPAAPTGCTQQDINFGRC